MKLFLSWSGDVSKQVALELKDWLPLILPNVKPFLSPVDVEKGSKWQNEISAELSSSNYGLICLTRGNLESQWLAFEAGALSKNIDGKAATLLLGISHGEVGYPLAMFQGSLFNKDDFLQLVKDINKADAGETQRDDRHIDRLFEGFWPELEEKVNLIIASDTAKSDAKNPGGSAEPSVQVSAVSSLHEKQLEELLVMVRQQLRILSSPSELFKPVIQEMTDLMRDVRSLSEGKWSANRSASEDSVKIAKAKGLTLNELLNAFKQLEDAKPKNEIYTQYLLKKISEDPDKED